MGISSVEYTLCVCTFTVVKIRSTMLVTQPPAFVCCSTFVIHTVEITGCRFVNQRTASAL
jgi:hypothetical protein